MDDDATALNLTRSQIDTLGRRLRRMLSRAGTELTAAEESDFRLLGLYRSTFMAAYDEVRDAVEAFGYSPTGRPQKRIPSIIAKLDRERTRLSTMDDIAGCRIVVPKIADQDLARDRICEHFAGRVIVRDRRVKPSNGYRAVHVIVDVDAHRVEVQIRTDLQHAWAELCEKCADVFGLAVKYGGGPEEVRRPLDVSSALVGRIEDPGMRLPPDIGAELRETLVSAAESIGALAKRTQGGA